MHSLLANSIPESIKARLAWRANPSRAKNADKTAEGLGEHDMARARQYVVSGYALFWMHQGVVDPWFPKNGWETPFTKASQASQGHAGSGMVSMAC